MNVTRALLQQLDIFHLTNEQSHPQPYHCRILRKWRNGNTSIIYFTFKYNDNNNHQKKKQKQSIFSMKDHLQRLIWRSQKENGNTGEASHRHRTLIYIEMQSCTARCEWFKARSMQPKTEIYYKCVQNQYQVFSRKLRHKTIEQRLRSIKK